MSMLRVVALALALAVAGQAAARETSNVVRVQTLPGPCKNHYILSLPCESGLEWEVLPQSIMAHERNHRAALLGDGTVLVVGGGPYFRDSAAEPVGAERFDPSTGEWRATAPMNRYRGNNFEIVRLLDGRVMVIGGDDEMSVEVFDPARDLWTLAGSLHTPRGAFTATTLPDGKVLVAGGLDPGDANLASAEIWEPASGAWRPTTSMAEARSAHRALGLPDGRILVVGGIVQDYFLVWSTGSAELFDPVTETWSSAGSIDARVLHSLTLTDDGRALVVGGYFDKPLIFNGGEFVPSRLGSTSLYDPMTNTWISAGELNIARYSHLTIPISGWGMLVFGGDGIGAEHMELLASGSTSWRYIDALNSLPDSAGNYHSATTLADGSVLFIGNGRRAVRLRY